MEFKFKTIYNNQLVDCEIDTHEDLIYRYVKYPHSESTVKCMIGRIKNSENRLLPVLPVFQYTGKKDCDGKEIYTGHTVRQTYGCGFTGRVEFDQLESRFIVRDFETGCWENLSAFGTILKIVEHSHVKNQEDIA